jgi:hypothetical protein
MATGALDAVSANRRPHYVTSLLTGGEDHPTWAYANQRAVRFYVVNLEQVLGRMNLNVTGGRTYFDESEKDIQKNTIWRNDHPFVYECSHTQIYNDKIRNPKLFGHAATIIVAMEIAAREKNPTLNVYDYLRILPAQYFPDRFEAARLKALAEHHHDLPADQRIEKFGADAADKSFEEVCLAHIEQTRVGLLDDVASGDCLTKYTAAKIVEFVNSNYPANLQIGPVRSAGEDGAYSEDLGRGNAVSGLRVPRTIPKEQLAPCL